MSDGHCSLPAAELAGTDVGLALRRHPDRATGYWALGFIPWELGVKVPAASCSCRGWGCRDPGQPVALQGKTAPCRAPCCWAPLTLSPKPLVTFLLPNSTKITEFIISPATPTGDNALPPLPVASGPFAQLWPPTHHPGYSKPNPGEGLQPPGAVLPTGGGCTWVSPEPGTALGPQGGTKDCA